MVLNGSPTELVIQCQRSATICQHNDNLKLSPTIAASPTLKLHHCHHCPDFCPSFGQREALAAALHILQHILHILHPSNVVLRS